MAANDKTPEPMTPEQVVKTLHEVIESAGLDATLKVMAGTVKRIREGDDDQHTALKGFRDGAARLRGQLEQCRKALAVKRDGNGVDPYFTAGHTDA